MTKPKLTLEEALVIFQEKELKVRYWKQFKTSLFEPQHFKEGDELVEFKLTCTRSEAEFLKSRELGYMPEVHFRRDPETGTIYRKYVRRTEERKNWGYSVEYQHKYYWGATLQEAIDKITF